MDRDRHRRPRSVFWRVAASLVAIQLATGFLAIGLSLYLASDRSADLAENSLRVRMDTFAEEIERGGASLSGSLDDLSPTLLQDLSYRFPDPLILADTTGRILQLLYPDQSAFSASVADSSTLPVVPPAFSQAIRSGEIVIDASSDVLNGGWASAPLYDAAGGLIGGFVIQPIERTVARELMPTRAAYRTAFWFIAIIAICMAILLAGVFTWWLVRPLRRITAKVVQIGSGDYTARVAVQGRDEIAQLGQTVNRMADQVSDSIHALRSTDQVRRELVANVGHDLRTPLAAISGYIEECVRYFEEGRLEKATEAMEAASTQAGYLHRLVDDLFELAQLENPSPTLRSEPVPLAELLGEATRSHADRMEKAGIVFTQAIPPSLPVIQADGIRLKRLFDNLLSNAVRHTPSGGSIHLTAGIDHEGVVVSVEDTGEGMDDASLAQIFDRYYRGASSRTRDDRGTGLGLAISRAVAELHGGTLEAESSLGRGTKMTVRLPVVS